MLVPSRLQASLTNSFMIPQRMVAISAGQARIPAVALEALSAHALRDTIAEHAGQSTWQTAVDYHLAHTAPMLALIGWKSDHPDRRPRHVPWTSACWATGIMLFRGSLCLPARMFPSTAEMPQPKESLTTTAFRSECPGGKFVARMYERYLGGIFLLAGWMITFAAGWQDRPQSPPANN